MTGLPSIRLECKTGGSNKFYTLEIVAVPGAGYMVNGASGAIDGTATPRPQTKNPVALEDAMKIFNAKVKEQEKKQYIQVSGAAVQFSPITTAYPGETRKSSGIQPQLLRDVSEDELPMFMNDVTYAMLQKMDGVRRLVSIDDNHAVGINRNGEEVPLEQALEKELVLGWRRYFRTGRTILDGELIGSTLWLFDVLEAGGDDWRGRGFYQRHLELQQFIRAAVMKPALVDLVNAEVDEGQKWAYMKLIQDAGGEGVVFRLNSSPYTPGRPNKGGDALKFKFWHDIDVIAGPGREGKRSIGAYLIDAITNQKVFMGYVMVPANYPMPAMDYTAVCKVRYLYAVDKLYQPQYEGERDDKRVGECKTTQKIYYKNNTEPEDA